MPRNQISRTRYIRGLNPLTTVLGQTKTVTDESNVSNLHVAIKFSLVGKCAFSKAPHLISQGHSLGSTCICPMADGGCASQACKAIASLCEPFRAHLYCPQTHHAPRRPPRQPRQPTYSTWPFMTSTWPNWQLERMPGEGTKT